MSPNPIVLVHGLYDTTAKLRKLSSHLQGLGWSVYALNLTPNDGKACLKSLAHQVAQFIADHFSPEQPIDLLGFSMGGLVTRYYLQRLGGVERVERYITISAPNKGTVTAYGLPYEGVKQMRPNSEFIRDLNQDWHEYQEKLQITTLWTPFDLMIVPAISSCLGFGKEIALPVWVHAWMVDDARTLNLVTQALSEPLSATMQDSRQL